MGSSCAKIKGNSKAVEFSDVCAVLPEQLLASTLTHGEDQDEVAALPTLTSFCALALLFRGSAEVSLPQSEEFRWWRRKLSVVEEPTCCICCLRTHHNVVASRWNQQQLRLISPPLNFISKTVSSHAVSELSDYFSCRLYLTLFSLSYSGFQ